VYVRVPGPSSFGLLVNGTRRRENVLISLLKRWALTSSVRPQTNQAHGYKKGTPEKSIPWIFWVVVISLIKKDGQLVTRYHNFATAQLFLRPRNIREVTKWCDNTYSALFQSRSAGHSKAPVRSWWNPRSVFTLRTSGGFNCCPWGAIQSRTAPFKLLVSSDLAPEAPFWIYTYCSNLKAPLQR
jgi:hypothetical protein